MRTRPCCWVSYDKLRPRTKLGKKPLSLSGWIHDGGYGPGPGPGAYAEIQLHGHDRQRYSYIGISEASWFSAQPRRMRLLSGHDQLVSSGFHWACWVVSVCDVVKVYRNIPHRALALEENLPKKSVKKVLFVILVVTWGLWTRSGDS